MAGKPTAAADSARASAALTKPSQAVSSYVQPKRGSEALSPTWKEFNPLGGIKGIGKALSTVRKALSKVGQILDKAVEMLEALRSIVSILSVFEAMLSNVLYAFVQVIVEQCQQVLNDVKSTGVYVLDMTSYHWRNRAETVDPDETDYHAAMNGSAWSNDAEWAAAEDAPASKKTPITSLLAQLAVSYRKESYNEFINVACDAFLDENDVPETAIMNALAAKNGLALLAPGGSAMTVDSDRTREEKKAALGSAWKSSGMEIPRFLQSGRPAFGDKGNMSVVFVAFCMPQVDQVVTLTMMLTKMLKLDMVKSPNSILKALTDGTNEAWGKIKDAFKETGENTHVEGWRDFNSFGQGSSGRPWAPGKEPNFIGVNAYQLAAPLFDKIQQVLDYLRSLSISTDQSLLKVIDDMLVSIEESVLQIVRVVAMIDHLVTMIESFLSLTGIRVLTFTTNRGNAGVVEALRSAKGFNEGSRKDETDKNRQEAQDRISEATNALNAASRSLQESESAMLQTSRKASQAASAISSTSVDEAYFASIGAQAPAYYDPAAPESAWSRYPAAVRTLYESLAELNATADEYLARADKARADKASAAEELSDAEDDYAAADPAAAERRLRSAQAREIRSLKSKADSAAAEYAAGQTRAANLASVLAIAGEWVSHAQSAGLAQKRKDMATAQSAYNSEIASLQAEAAAFAAQGLASIQAALASVVQEKSWANDGRTEGGIRLTLGYNGEIAALQAERAGLVEQNSDPEAPQPEDYEERLAQIDAQIAAIEAEQAAANAVYDSEIAHLTYAESFVAGTDPASYETARGVAVAALGALKDDNDPGHAGSTAEAYKLADDAHAAAIAAAGAKIASLDAELTAVVSAEGALYGKIATLGVDPSDYPSTTTPWPPTGEPWDSHPELRHYFDGTVTPPAAPPAPPTTPPPVTPTPDYQSFGYWWCNETWKPVLAAERAYQAALAEAEAEAKEANLAEWDAFSAGNIREQTYRWGYTIPALDGQIGSRDKAAEASAVEAERDAATAAQQAEIDGIVQSGWDEHLYKANAYYKGGKPSAVRGKDGKPTWSDWTGNEVGWLMAAHNYNRFEPRIVDGRAADVENGVAAWTQGLELLRRAKESAESAYQAAYKKEQKRQKKYDEKKRVRDLWTPTQKMYYGGIIMCVGWPDFSGDEMSASYFNVGQVYSDFWKDPLGGDSSLGSAVGDAAKKLNKQFGVITSLFK